jgi:hypothetical protein
MTTTFSPFTENKPYVAELIIVLRNILCEDDAREIARDLVRPNPQASSLDAYERAISKISLIHDPKGA